jgi:hypothetical protein
VVRIVTYLSVTSLVCLQSLRQNIHSYCSYPNLVWMYGLSLATIKSYLSSVRSLLINAGVSSPVIYTPRVELVIRGIKHAKVGLGSPARSRLPITPNLLLKLKGVWSIPPLTTDKLMLWAAVCIAFFWVPEVHVLNSLFHHWWPMIPTDTFLLMTSSSFIPQRSLQWL